MQRFFVVLSVCFFLVGCQGQKPSTFSTEQVQIVAEGVSDAGLELVFAVDEQGWTCPGVKVSRSEEGRIDVYFLRVRDQDTGRVSCDVPAVKDGNYSKALKVKIPHDWSERKEVEVFIDGTKPLGKCGFGERISARKRSRSDKKCYPELRRQPQFRLG